MLSANNATQQAILFGKETKPMTNNLGSIKLAGVSGKTYEFHVFDSDAPLEPIGAVYTVTKVQSTEKKWWQFWK